MSGADAPGVRRAARAWRLRPNSGDHGTRSARVEGGSG